MLLYGEAWKEKVSPGADGIYSNPKRQQALFTVAECSIVPERRLRLSVERTELKRVAAQKQRAEYVYKPVLHFQ